MILHTYYCVTRLAQDRVTLGVMGHLQRFGVNGSVEFEDEPQSVTVEIDDITPEYMLPAELETEQPAAAEQFPSSPLCRG